MDRRLLADVDRRLGLGKDGQALSGWTTSRFRKLALACIRRAVELDLLGGDPWPPVPKGRSRRKTARPRSIVDVRSLPDPQTMERAIAAIPSHQPSSRTYQAMIAVMYYGGLRPSEAIMCGPARSSCRTRVGGGSTSSKPTSPSTSPANPRPGRTVPIPPVLVTMLRKWIDEHGFAEDELIFRTRTGNRPTASNWSRTWQRAHSGWRQGSNVETQRLQEVRVFELQQRPKSKQPLTARRPEGLSKLRLGTPLGSHDGLFDGAGRERANGG